MDFIFKKYFIFKDNERLIFRGIQFFEWNIPFNLKAAENGECRKTR